MRTSRRSCSQPTGGPSGDRGERGSRVSLGRRARRVAAPPASLRDRSGRLLPRPARAAGAELQRHHLRDAGARPRRSGPGGPGGPRGGGAVAAGLVPFAIGSETSGSILTPAAYCGVTGLRPTYGLVSRHGAMALSWTMDKLGPMARRAHDCGLVLAAIAGRDPADPSSLERGFRYPVSGGPRRRWRIAVPQGATDGIQAEVAANFTAALDRLRAAGVVVTDVAVPDLPFGVVAGIIHVAHSPSAVRRLVP